MIYLQLFFSFLQIGALSFGGGYAAMPLIQEQVVTMHGWISMETFSDLVTIAEMTPGPIAVNSATFVGTRIAGPGGRSGGYSWLYFTLLYNCNPAGIYLHEIPENVPSPGNSYIPSSGGCGHDRQGRSYHFSIIFFYKWCSGTVSGKHMHSNGGILYCRTGAFEKI